MNPFPCVSLVSLLSLVSRPVAYHKCLPRVSVSVVESDRLMPAGTAATPATPAAEAAPASLSLSLVVFFISVTRSSLRKKKKEKLGQRTARDGASRRLRTIPQTLHSSPFHSLFNFIPLSISLSSFLLFCCPRLSLLLAVCAASMSCTCRCVERVIRNDFLRMTFYRGRCPSPQLFVADFPVLLAFVFYLFAKQT